MEISTIYIFDRGSIVNLLLEYNGKTIAKMTANGNSISGKEIEKLPLEEKKLKHWY